MTKAIELRDVSYKINGKIILEDISLCVRERDFLCIIGPNGGGKTTLLKIILGLLKPSSGDVRVLGTLPEEARRFVGYVPQEPPFDMRFPINVFRVILLARYPGVFRRFSREDEKKVLEVMGALGIEHLKN